jgi:aspartate/methionine/tyrosine aminotransferase
MAAVERISRRIGAIAESATLAVDAKAKALKAAGEDVIGFGAGEPDFPTPDAIVEAAAAACKDPANHRYTPTGGLPELRQAIVAKSKRDSGLTCTEAQVLVTNGGKQALYNTFAALLDPGDEVLLPAPYWTTYPESITLAGGTPVVVPTTVASGFRATIDQLDAACTPRTKALVFVSPSNPSGAVYPPAEVEAIGRWAVAKGIWVVTDEIYEHLTFGEHSFSSMPVLVPELTDTCVVVNGVAKTYAMTGWRVGWMIGPVDVVKAATNLQSHSTSNVADVSQRAAVAALNGDLSAVAMMRAAFERRGRTMYELLNAIPGVTAIEPQGAFYGFPSLEGVLGRSIRGRMSRTTTELSEVLLEEAKVAIVPGEAFGAPGYARLSFALSDDDIVEGITRIAKLLAE